MKRANRKLRILLMAGVGSVLIVVLGLYVASFLGARQKAGRPDDGTATRPAGPAIASMEGAAASTRSSGDDLSVSLAEELGQDILRQADAAWRVPVHRWQLERIRNIRQETIQQTVRNLANFDDRHLAATGLGGTIIINTDAVGQTMILTRLARVRRLLETGREQPEAVLPHLRAALRESIKDWREALRRRQETRRRFEEAGQAMSFAEPDDHDKLKEGGTAATYLLAELGDHKSVLLLAQSYESSLDPALAYPAVPAGLTLYAMDRLVSSYPVSELSGRARRAREAYLAHTKGWLAPPRQETVTGWGAAYTESDPRLAVLHPRVIRKELLLRDQPTLTLHVYPCTFADGTRISNLMGKVVSPKGQLLWQQLKLFVDTLGS